MQVDGGEKPAEAATQTEEKRMVVTFSVPVFILPAVEIPPTATTAETGVGGEGGEVAMDVDGDGRHAVEGEFVFPICLRLGFG